MKKFFISLTVILLLALALMLIIKKGNNDYSYNFILHFDEAEKSNFDNKTALNTFAFSKPLTFDYDFFFRHLQLLFSGDVKVLLQQGNAGKTVDEKISNGGFRFVFPAKGTTGTYKFFFKKKDSSNYWLVEYTFHGESCDITTVRCKSGKTEEINKLDYQIRGEKKKVFSIVFFSDFLVLLDKNNILFQMRDPVLDESGNIGLDCEMRTAGNRDSLVKFAQMTEKSEADLLDWHKHNLPEMKSYKFNTLEREWNGISYRQNLIVSGKQSDFLQRFKIGDVVRPSIFFTMNASLIYTLKIPENGLLEFYLSVVPFYVHKLERLRFTASVEEIKSNKTRIFTYDFGKISKIPNSFIPCSMNLKEFGGSKCRVTFKFATSDGKLQADEKKILLLLSSPAIYQLRKVDEYNVILISLDTLRASNLGCYGYPRKTSENMDKFAGEGTVFKSATACSDWTLPSHMSMLTSTYPFECGLIKSEKIALKKVGMAFEGSFVADETQTIAGYLQEASYKTIAVHGGRYLSEFYGFDKGFSVYHEMKGNAEEAVELAIKYLENNKKNKFFLFFHTYEIHAPYEHDYFLTQLSPSELTTNNKTIARYDSGIRYTDIQIGRLIDWLKKNRLFEKTLVIITSDHGENFDRIRTVEEIGSHGNTLYDSETQVPLILGGCAPFNKKFAVSDQVSSADILPTIMDFLGIPVDDNVRGISLMPLIEGKKVARRMAYSEGIRAVNEKKSVRTLDNKLIATLKRKSTKNADETDYELYDLIRDGQESKNIYALKPGIANTLVQNLKQIWKSVETNRRKLAKKQHELPQKNEQLLRDLKGLGYLGN